MKRPNLGMALALYGLSLLVFGLLAGVMLLTRRLDWYSLGRGA